jgi:orotate phosphoribosyltransferase
MTEDIFKTVPARGGHFLLESGYHTDFWLTLDALFVSPQGIATQVSALADLLRPYQPNAICGPLLGGAFLAQALATQMGLRFYFTQQMPSKRDGSLFTAEYRLPPELRRRVKGESIAIVDDCISAGSSVRATAAELAAAGAKTLAVGTLLLLGDEAVEYFSALDTPVVAVSRRGFKLWTATECPLCQSGESLENPSL